MTPRWLRRPRRPAPLPLAGGAGGGPEHTPHPAEPAPPAPGQPNPPEAETWSRGDLAECLYPGPWQFHPDGQAPAFGPGPVFGEIRMVEAARVSRNFMPGATFLEFARYPGGYHAVHFRKIVPRPDRRETTRWAGLDHLLGLPSERDGR